MRSEIGQLVYQMVVKRHPFPEQLKRRLKKLVNETHHCEVQLEPRMADPVVERFVKADGSDYTLEQLQKAFRNIEMKREIARRKALPKFGRMGLASLLLASAAINTK